MDPRPGPARPRSPQAAVAMETPPELRLERPRTSPESRSHLPPPQFTASQLGFGRALKPIPVRSTPPPQAAMAVNPNCVCWEPEESFSLDLGGLTAREETCGGPANLASCSS
ncbi:hypothetical protein BTVI_49071 [Pitangus sulphuratus]|nr:hypothetical protein BTVI_49071 [Pitangus sulphuratus]